MRAARTFLDAKAPAADSNTSKTYRPENLAFGVWFECSWGVAAHSEASEFETDRENDRWIRPSSIKDVRRKIHSLIGETREEASLHIKRCLICPGSLRS